MNKLQTEQPNSLRFQNHMNSLMSSPTKSPSLKQSTILKTNKQISMYSHFDQNTPTPQDVVMEKSKIFQTDQMLRSEETIHKSIIEPSRLPRAKTKTFISFQKQEQAKPDFEIEFDELHSNIKTKEEYLLQHQFFFTTKYSSETVIKGIEEIQTLQFILVDYFNFLKQLQSFRDDIFGQFENLTSKAQQMKMEIIKNCENYSKTYYLSVTVPKIREFSQVMLQLTNLNNQANDSWDIPENKLVEKSVLEKRKKQLIFSQESFEFNDEFKTLYEQIEQYILQINACLKELQDSQYKMHLLQDDPKFHKRFQIVIKHQKEINKFSKTLLSQQSLLIGWLAKQEFKSLSDKLKPEFDINNEKSLIKFFHLIKQSQEHLTEIADFEEYIVLQFEKEILLVMQDLNNDWIKIEDFSENSKKLNRQKAEDSLERNYQTMEASQKDVQKLIIKKEELKTLIKNLKNKTEIIYLSNLSGKILQNTEKKFKFDESVLMELHEFLQRNQKTEGISKGKQLQVEFDQFAKKINITQRSGMSIK